ncbi:MAG: 4Fe-4S binding protein [Lachnospiraceae bacterium]|nr:4Fe-4S binding protein [Lachnospiraceae bacterium]
MEQRKTITPAKKRMRRKKIQNIVRRIVQVIFFIFLPSLFSEAFSGLKGLFRQIGQGEVLSWNAFLQTFVILSVITILAGRWFCGFACAFGSLGDAMYEISVWVQKKLKKRLPKIPEKICIALQKIKYIHLLFLLFACMLGVANVIENNSPWAAFSRMRMLDFNINGYFIGFLYLLLILIGMIFEERFFCQFLCPLGAVFSLLPIIPAALLKREETNCIPNCNACKKQCPVHHKVEGASLESNECIRCGRCIGVCPKSNIKVGIFNNSVLQKYMSKLHK